MQTSDRTKFLGMKGYTVLKPIILNTMLGAAIVAVLGFGGQWVYHNQWIVNWLGKAIAILVIIGLCYLIGWFFTTGYKKII
jgi:integral membrane sensor domain MASE1